MDAIINVVDGNEDEEGDAGGAGGGDEDEDADSSDEGDGGVDSDHEEIYAKIYDWIRLSLTKL